ncbi:hypothetical protein, partial [Pseudomonas viridiflava]|uniref:hypothetical protein n=1 Tax=Pseudomonas viridiflava TaxID=33069 RepID=UPI00197FC1D4
MSSAIAGLSFFVRRSLESLIACSPLLLPSSRNTLLLICANDEDGAAAVWDVMFRVALLMKRAPVLV